MQISVPIHQDGADLAGSGRLRLQIGKETVIAYSVPVLQQFSTE